MEKQNLKKLKLQNEYNEKINKINSKIDKYSTENKSSANKKNIFNPSIRKNLIFISCFMIFVHVLGLIYQILSNQPTLSILLKELFIAMFITQIVLVKIEFKYAKYICYALNTAIAIISGYYSDFSSVIISVLIIFYLFNLNNNFEINNTKSRIENSNTKKNKRI